ncbi:MFS transporter [Paenibacillus senegalensis]|uniref:MFS transporter n=1 Tax=Paenibacillus senegalensis TaxID=1465766 RepID=UPI00028978A5|nr:MFS transporter [Paenibacillus senegalensis]
MKTAVWLYLFIFVAFFDLHAQYPILSPFAVSLGATPSFIGLLLGMYSITHLPGNLLAGYGVDRYGSKPFLVISLIGAGILLLLQAQVHDPWQLLVIRSISGFVLAFLSPACLAMLAKIAKDQIQQGKLMAGNGLIHTLASVVSPAAGAMLVAKLGFTASFTWLGWGLLLTGFLAIFFVKESKSSAAPVLSSLQAGTMTETEEPPAAVPWLFYLAPLGISCSQGILFFELPLMASAEQSILTSGLLFSLVSLGALTTLSLLFLHRYSPYMRTLIGCFALAMIFFVLAVKWPIPLYVSLFMIGMAKGIILPAISTYLASSTSSSRYGRIFSILSVAFSVGSFIGPVLAGQLRSVISPYYIAFLVLMIGLTLLPYGKSRPIVTA